MRSAVDKTVIQQYFAMISANATQAAQMSPMPRKNLISPLAPINHITGATIIEAGRAQLLSLASERAGRFDWRKIVGFAGYGAERPAQ
jgi:hypothetical protein